MRPQIQFNWLPVAICLVLAIMLSVPASAQQGAREDAWQSVVAAQIEAFRARDAETAFSYAANSFHDTYPDAEAFFDVILGYGYGPILDSRSHRFVAFKELEGGEVIQEVELVGRDQSLFSASYRLGQEASGWRVEAVALRKMPGLAI